MLHLNGCHLVFLNDRATFLWRLIILKNKIKGLTLSHYLHPSACAPTNPVQTKFTWTQDVKKQKNKLVDASNRRKNSSRWNNQTEVLLLIWCVHLDLPYFCLTSIYWFVGVSGRYWPWSVHIIIDISHKWLNKTVHCGVSVFCSQRFRTAEKFTYPLCDVTDFLTNPCSDL